jgi:hypothetical protein
VQKFEHKHAKDKTQAADGPTYSPHHGRLHTHDVSGKSTRRMPSSDMSHSVVLVGTDVSEEGIASIIKITRTDELGTTLAITSNRVFLRSVLRLPVTANTVPS